MLHLIGLGLYSYRDLGLQGLEVLRKCNNVYAELYTNYFGGDLSGLEELIGKKITILDRAGVEENPDEMLEAAMERDVALLVSGDPMVATTHVDLVLRAEKRGVKTRVIHSSSIYSAIAETGLQIYRFGKTTTLAFPEKNYRPMSPYDVIEMNLKNDMHSLVLLDVKADQSRYMTVSEGMQLLIEFEEEKKKNVFKEDTLCIGVARLGSEDYVVKYGTARELLDVDFGGPPHTLLLPNRKFHPMEAEALERYRV